MHFFYFFSLVSLLGVHFSSPQKSTIFLSRRRYVKPTLNVQMSKSVVKIWQLIGGAGGGAPSHGTTGTTVNPTL